MHVPSEWGQAIDLPRKGGRIHPLGLQQLDLIVMADDIHDVEDAPHIGRQVAF
jgi:hypothetical protein